MTTEPDRYQQLALATWIDRGNRYDNLDHALGGLASETGEAVGYHNKAKYKPGHLAGIAIPICPAYAYARPGCRCCIFTGGGPSWRCSVMAERGQRKRAEVVKEKQQGGKDGYSTTASV